MKTVLRILALASLWGLSPLLHSASPDTKGISVRDFGAIPDDGQCDTLAIQEAIDTAIREGHRTIRFELGVYNLINVKGKQTPYMDIRKAKDLTLLGAVNPDGSPATRLERVAELSNTANPFHQLSIEDSSGISVKNFVITNNPAFGSTGRVISVDKEKDEVVVEVLPGLPSYDGMRAASAHAWNLETSKLKRFGSNPTEATLTIGTKVNVFWQAVPGSNNRRLKMSKAGWAKKVEVGDGISWHHNASDVTTQTRVMHSQDISFENIVMPNVTGMGMLVAYSHNITFKKFRFAPENGNLAIGSRDGFHLSMNSGTLLIEDCYFKGLRMDPLVLRKTYGIIKEVGPDNTILVDPSFSTPKDGIIRAWFGEQPTDLTVIKSKRSREGSRYQIKESLPKGLVKDTPVTFENLALSQGIIRNSTFEDNFGSAIVNFEANITVENCVFDNNSYQLKYGPNPVSGGWVRNNVIRNNTFKNISWIDITRKTQPAFILIHSASKFFKNPMYNQDIEIYGNTFIGGESPSNAVVYYIRNAQNILIRDNHYQGVPEILKIDPKTTRNIKILDKP